MHRSLDLRPEPRAACAAREFVAATLRDAVAGEVAEVAVLLTSELVTNAVVHARTPIHVVVDVEARTLRVTVADDAPRSPALRPSSHNHLTGRGLNLVDALAGQWGVDPTREGKKVWFELGA